MRQVLRIEQALNVNCLNIAEAELADDRRYVQLDGVAIKTKRRCGARHTALIKLTFQGVSSEELQQFELILKKIGKRAESLAEKKRHSDDQVTHLHNGFSKTRLATAARGINTRNTSS